MSETLSFREYVEWDVIIQEAWLRGELSWKLHKAQMVIYNLIKNLPRKTREALLFCARRFGKSFLGVVLALEDCLQNSGVQVAIIGPTIKQTKKILAPIIRKITKDAPIGLIRQLRSTDTWHCANGSLLMLGGFDTIFESFRGVDLFSIYLEETGSATPDPDEYVYLLYSILFPTMMHSRGRLHHLTTPSRIIDHPLHIETLPKCRLSNAFYEFDIYKNPLLTADEIEEEIELLGGIDSISTKRELLVQIVRDDSITVVTTFDEARHVADVEPSHQLAWMVGGDLGYVDDLSGFVRGGYDHNIGKVIVRDERWFYPVTPSSEIVHELKEWDALPLWKHPSYQRAVESPTHVVDIQGNTRTDMSTIGLTTGEVIKDKFDSTITFIRNEFYNDRLIIHPDCKLLIETLRSAVFNKTKNNFKRTSVIGHADLLMALVYLLRSVDRVTDLRPKPDPMQLFVRRTDSPLDANIKNLGWRSSK